MSALTARYLGCFTICICHPFRQKNLLQWQTLTTTYFAKFFHKKCPLVVSYWVLVIKLSESSQISTWKTWSVGGEYLSISTLRLNWDRFSEHDKIISWLKAPPRLLVAINRATLQYSRHKHGLALTVPFGVRHHYFRSYARSLYKHFLIRDCSVWITTFIHGQWYRLLHHPFDICACQMRFIFIRRGQHESWPVAIDDIHKKKSWHSFECYGSSAWQGRARCQKIMTGTDP